MAITNVALSLFHRTNELEKTHHLVIIECGYVNKLVSGIVNLALMHEHIRHLVNLSASSIWTFAMSMEDELDFDFLELV